MSYNKEQKQSAQKAYHEARAFGHTKEEARSIRDQSKLPSHISSSCECDDEWEDLPEPYSQDCCDD